MDAITFFALFAVAATTALLVAAGGITFVLWAAAAIMSKLLRKRGAGRDARLTPGMRPSPLRLHVLKID